MKVLKLCIFNVVIAIVSVLLYSPGFVGLSIFGSALSTAMCVSAGVAILLTLIYGNAKLLGISKKSTLRIYKQDDFQNYDDYAEVLSAIDKKVFDREVTTMLSLIDRLNRKVKMIDVILLQLFDSEEMSYKNYRHVIGSISSVFYGNVQSLINRVNIFDEEEYAKNKESKSSIDHIESVHRMLNDNAAIVKKVDSLLAEVGKLTESGTSLDRLPAMLDLEDLISNTKLYKE